MRFITALLFLLPCLVNFGSPSRESDEFIFTAVAISKENAPLIMFDVRTVFQRDIGDKLELYVKEEMKVEQSKEYLITLVHDLNTDLWEIIEIVPLEEATAKVQSLFYAIHCIDEDKKHNRPCQRDLQPVCGCDGKYYGNLCEARKAGVNIYSHGRCAESTER
jgi:hypothetical protein